MDLPAAILDIIFPPKCAFCGALLGDEEKEVCARCAKALPYRGPGETMRSVDGFDCAVTFYYAGPVVDGVHALKFQNKPGRAAVFGRLLAQTAAEELGGRFDAVTFVPVSARRNFSRGYDQARLLAEAAGRVWGVKAEKFSEKPGTTAPSPPSNLQRSGGGTWRPPIWFPGPSWRRGDGSCWWTTWSPPAAPWSPAPGP